MTEAKKDALCAARNAAERAGIAAFRAGLPMEANPHATMTRKHYRAEDLRGAWRIGWLRASWAAKATAPA